MSSDDAQVCDAFSRPRAHALRSYGGKGADGKLPRSNASKWIAGPDRRPPPSLINSRRRYNDERGVTTITCETFRGHSSRRRSRLWRHGEHEWWSPSTRATCTLVDRERFLLRVQRRAVKARNEVKEDVVKVKYISISNLILRLAFSGFSYRHFYCLLVLRWSDFLNM